jgi:molecular chaperone Hsp33
MTKINDELNRFLFDNLHVRGELVQLNESIAQMMKNHQYPDGVKLLLSELMVATSLLTATLKFEGEITVQIQGDGPVAYMAINGNDKQQLRGVARIVEPTDAIGLTNLIGKGNMIITIRPTQGEAYQGVVALTADNLADCLGHYFETSEQIPTKIWLFSDASTNQAAGALIQLLPDGEDKEQQLADFEHLCQLTNTIKANEVFTLTAQDLLYRLYHQEVVRLFEPQPVSFVCGCSEDKCLTAISQMKPDEISAILQEQGAINMTCDYCLTEYSFDHEKLAPLLTEAKH